MNTLIVTCHPDPASFTMAVAERAIAAIRGRGDEVRVTDLYGEGFDPLFTGEERDRHLEPGADPAVAHHTDDLQWCTRLVLVYPTWWSGQPAMMKGWIERVWVRDVAFDLPPGVQPGARPPAQRAPPGGDHDPRVVQARQRHRG